MTREQFLNGTPFHFINENKKSYHFTKFDSGKSIGMITFMGTHECNVTKVTEKYVHAYNVTVGKVSNFRFELEKFYI